MSRSVDQCFDELRPLCVELARLVTGAPIPIEQRRDLAARVAAFQFGTAIGIAKAAAPELNDIPDHEFAKFIGDQIVGLMERDGKALSS